MLVESLLSLQFGKSLSALPDVVGPFLSPQNDSTDEVGNYFGPDLASLDARSIRHILGQNLESVYFSSCTFVDMALNLDFHDA